MKALRSVTLLPILALIFIVGSFGYNQTHKVVDLADSGWTPAEPGETATVGEPEDIPALVAAGWRITPISISELER